MLEVERLTVTFGSGPEAVRAVEDLSFSVAAGESFGLVGESGSGKTTVLRAVAGLLPGWEGGIRIAGEVRPPRITPKWARQVQMIFQDPYGSLHPRHTVDRALAEPLSVQGLPAGEARIAELLQEVGLGPGFRFRFPHQLSGGQRQRVAIARALALRPRLLLLDEPTSALDVSVQAEVLNLLARLRRELGLTYLLVSHNLAVVVQLCDRLLVMSQGRLVETLTAEALRRGEAQHPYTRQLMTASRGYDRSAIEAFRDYAEAG